MAQLVAEKEVAEATAPQGRLPSRPSSLSLPEEVILGVRPPPPNDCIDCRAEAEQGRHHHHHHHSGHPELLSSYSVPPHTPPSLTKPHRIIIVRHGESTGNVDEQVYVTTPDWKVPLSEKGHQQARETGKSLKELIGDEPLYIYTSPYLRTKQTLAGILESFEDNLKIGIREEPRITEQQFGNFQNHDEMKKAKKDRGQFGRFYYRFPQGESGLDVYTRVTSFISTMFRDFADGHICRPDLNVIIVTHGLTLRLLLMRWFKFTVDTFESTTNPPNGSYIVMSRREGDAILKTPGRTGGGVYELPPESAELISLSCGTVPIGPPLKTPSSHEDIGGAFGSHFNGSSTIDCTTQAPSSPFTNYATHLVESLDLSSSQATNAEGREEEDVLRERGPSW